MKKSRYSEVPRILLVICIGIFLITGVFNSIESRAGNDNTDEYHEWRVNINQTNETWPVLLKYENLTVFYQDLFLECRISSELKYFVNLSDENTTLSLQVINGTAYISNLSSMDFYRWRSWENREEMDTSNIPYLDIFVKPTEKDVNFNVTLMLSIYNETNCTKYSEAHTFWIVGEPKIVQKDDLIEKVGIIRTYVISLIAGLVILSIIPWNREIGGGGSE